MQLAVFKGTASDRIPGLSPSSFFFFFFFFFKPDLELLKVQILSEKLILPAGTTHVGGTDGFYPA